MKPIERWNMWDKVFEYIDKRWWLAVPFVLIALFIGGIWYGVQWVFGRDEF